MLGCPSAQSLWDSAAEMFCPPPCWLLLQPSPRSPTNLSRWKKKTNFFSPRQHNSETTSGEFLPFYLSSKLSSGRSSEFYLEEGEESQAGLQLDWSQLPEELSVQSGGRRKKTNSSKVKLTAKKKSNIDIQRTLTALEQRENKSESDEKQETQDDSEEEEKEKLSEHGSDAGEPDEEMDGGTDYANNYFDNGEDYLDDEDDNLDEGGIY